MSERYEVHSMIYGMDIGDTMDLEVCKSLIEKYGSSRDIDLLITDNGRNMSYGEVADQLNRYHKREEILKQAESMGDLVSIIANFKEKVSDLEIENKLLNEKVSDLDLKNKQLQTEIGFLEDTIEMMKEGEI